MERAEPNRRKPLGQAAATVPSASVTPTKTTKVCAILLTPCLLPVFSVRPALALARNWRALGLADESLLPHQYLPCAPGESDRCETPAASDPGVFPSPGSDFPGASVGAV